VTDFSLIYITCKDLAEAKKIASALLEKKLIACANILPQMISLYNWQNQLTESNETLLLVKTTRDKFLEVECEVYKHHSYSCPCIVSMPVEDCNPEYAKWLKESLA
jgi:periplasmic divalent cation tolerance protein